MQAKDYPRSVRVGDQIQRVLAELVDREIDDPRVRHVTLSEVRVSRDLGQATVYVTPASGSDGEAAVRALNGAARFIRRRLSERVRLKYVPRIRFAHDTTLDHANRMDRLIDQAIAREGARGEPEGES